MPSPVEVLPPSPREEDMLEFELDLIKVFRAEDKYEAAVIRADQQTSHRP